MLFPNWLIAPEYKVMRLLSWDGTLIYENPDYYWDSVNENRRVKPWHEKIAEDKIKRYKRIWWKYDAIVSDMKKWIPFKV